MAITLPAFDQYQEPITPLRGLWNAIPKEGDKLVNIDIKWLATTKTNAVQFSLSGNSPVAISQIVAVAVDNSRSGADVDFVFPDTGFVLTVPAYNQLVAPVFTNALMFYVVSADAILGDQVVAQVFNSNPPAVSIEPSQIQNASSVTTIPLTTGNTVVVPLAQSGTLHGFNVIVTIVTPGAGVISLNGGTFGEFLWAWNFQDAIAGVYQFNVVGLNKRFSLGLVCRLTASAAIGRASVNVYYSIP